MADSQFTIHDARAWIEEHLYASSAVPLQRLSREARKLGYGALPAMVEVLGGSRRAEAIVAGRVLLVRDAKIERIGDAPEDVRLEVELPNGEKRSVHPRWYTADDFDECDTIPELPFTPDVEWGRMCLQFGLYAATAVGFAVGAYFTSGAISSILAVLAGVVAAITAWCVVAWGLIGLVIEVLKIFRRGQPPPRS